MARKSKQKQGPIAQLDRTQSDMKRFFRSVDWMSLWEDFYLGLNANGTKKWPGVRTFAKKNTENELQARFMEYYIGPNPPVVEVDKDWSFVEPQDWLKRRETGGWYTKETVKGIAATIAQNLQALQALGDVGNKITIPMLVRYAKLAEMVDNEFGGHLFSPDLSFDQNDKRARLYIRLHEDVLGLQLRAQEMFARNHGINFQMDGISQLMLGAKMNDALTGGSDPQTQRVKGVMNKIIDMTLTKSTTHDIPLPDEMESQIKTALAPAAKKPN